MSFFFHSFVSLWVYVLASGGEGYRVTAQMVLVCCWRSMKEVAMLLGQLCQSLPLLYTNDEEQAHPGLITEEQVRTRRIKDTSPQSNKY